MNRNSTPPRPAAIQAEEEFEARRHDQLYEQPDHADPGRMVPDDWERFDRIAVPTTPYHAAVKWLGDLRGHRVLDAGCGNGWLSIILAKRGAIIEGFDISPVAIQAAERRAVANDCADRCAFRVGSFYQIPFSEARYDLAIGASILHHLSDKARAAAELFRVMKPGGRAIFQEPFGNSLWLERIRRLVPVKSASPDDPDQWKHQFKYADLEPFREHFAIRWQEFGFFSRLERVISNQAFAAWLHRSDLRVLRRLPFLRRYARAIVLECTRPAAGSAAAHGETGRP